MPEHFISREQAENDLLACAAFLAERVKSSDGHAEAMNAIVPRYLSSGNVDLAAELANAVDDPFSRDRLLMVVAEKCAELDDVEYGLQLADAIEDQGMQAQALERVALVSAAKGDVAKAAEIADSMAHPDLVYAGIAVNQALGGDEAAAGATLDSIVFPAARVSALQQIAATQIHENKTERALVSLERGVAAAGDIEHDEEKIRALCDIASLYIEAKRNDTAIETFEQARAAAEALDNLHRDLFLVICSLGFLYAGSSELADRSLDLVADKTQMASALLGFSREYWKRGEKQDALDALDEGYEILKSQRESETRDSRARNALLASIAIQFAGFGKTERGVEITLENNDHGEQMAALSQIARILTVQKEDHLARQTIDQIAGDPERLMALVGMSDEKKNLGENAASLALLEESSTLAGEVPQLSGRSNVLNRIAERFVAHGMPERAREVALESLSVLVQIRDESSLAAALASLADVFVEGHLELGDEEKKHLHTLVQKAEW